MVPESVRQSFQRHRQDGATTTEAYVRRLTVTLGQSIAARRKLYLDTRYWILLRDVVLGRPRRPEHSAILEQLRDQVREGTALCPMSDITFTELLRQSDPTTRAATALLIDELSLGVAILSEEQRVSTELAHYLYDAGGGIDVHPIQNLVWTRIGFMLGMTWPSGLPVDQAELRVIQKAFIDQMWEADLATLIQTAVEAPPIPYPFDEIAQRLNDGNRAHARDVRSFQQAVLAEVAGGFDLMKSTLADIMCELYRASTGQDSRPPTAEERERQEERLRLLFINLFRKRPQVIGRRAPTLYIHGKCHAAVRWDRQRVLDGHDLLDFHHAAAAVGHCNAFFTETPLKALLTSGNVALHDEFPCRILATELEVLTYLDTFPG